MSCRNNNNGAVLYSSSSLALDDTALRCMTCKFLGIIRVPALLLPRIIVINIVNYYAFIVMPK
jgi:hypothetical protein